LSSRGVWHGLRLPRVALTERTKSAFICCHLWFLFFPLAEPTELCLARRETG